MHHSDESVLINFSYPILLSLSSPLLFSVLDLGCYYFSGNVPKSVGNLSELVKEGNDLAVAGGRRTGAGSEFGMGIRDRVWGYESFELIPVAESPTDITSLEEVCRRVSAEEGNGWVCGEDGCREEKGGRRREGVERGEGEPLL
ncbi:hypothetical protein TB2_002387 [Malus domestica]|uniref:Uncharacterized protein n=1 Tax=Malus domestica TaxID=3750 RepID=A0A498IW23_MALDO|nr:hypothetical protein DVH24_009434 [Malus domestica]